MGNIKREFGKEFRYLIYSFDNTPASFQDRLKKIGLEKLPFGIKLEELVKNNLITSTFRIDIPEEFYQCWENYPIIPPKINKISENYKCFLNYYIYKDFEEKCDEWFLHPYDRSIKETDIQKFLNKAIQNKLLLPKKIMHKKSILINPTKFYFNYSVGYYIWNLIPILLFTPILKNWGSLKKQITNIKNNAKTLFESNQLNLDRVSKYWNQFENAFDFISYYRNLISIVNTPDRSPKKLEEKIKEGRACLFAFLNIQQSDLEEFLHLLLILFQEWETRDYSFFPVNIKAKTELQKDIFYLIECLCHISGKKLPYFYEKFSYANRFKQQWAELKQALPFEEHLSLDHIIKTFQYYIDGFYILFPDYNISKSDIINTLTYLWKNSACFDNFLRAYKKLHQNLQPMNYGINFSDNDFIDHLIVIFIRSEALLREQTKDIQAKTIKSVFCKYKQIFQKDILKESFEFALNNWDYTRYQGGNNPFIKFEELATSNNKEVFGKNMLQVALVRNHFAHHNYLDNIILNKNNIGEIFKNLISVTLILLSFKLKSDNQI